MSKYETLLISNTTSLEHFFGKIVILSENQLQAMPPQLMLRKSILALRKAVKRQKPVLLSASKFLEAICARSTCSIFVLDRKRRTAEYHDLGAVHKPY